MVSQFQLSIETDKSRTGGTFTNYDIINGFIHLRNSTEITLNSIQVKLEGVSETVLYYEKINSQGKKERKRLRSLHKLLYDTSIVFPPKNVRDVAKSSKFTLIPGEYAYPFQFKIPLQNSCYKDQLANSSGQRHSCNKLPPSLSGLGEFATVKYFIKVTAKRSSLFKVNLRSFDPFVFLPVDSPTLMNRDQDTRQIFVRKEFILPNKLPDIVACYATPSSTKIIQYEKNKKVADSPQQKKPAGFFKTFFFGSEPTPQPSSPKRRSSSNSSPKIGTTAAATTTRPVYKPEVKPIDLPIYFEARFKYPAYMIPTKAPNFKLYLVSKNSPQFFELPNGESSGLGYIYMKSLHIVLHMKTTVEIEGHVQYRTSSKVLLDLNKINYRFDLHDVQRSNARDVGSGRSNLYELQIPKDVYKDAIVPDDVAPTFKSCNIERSYALMIESSFSSDKAITKQDPLVVTALVTDMNIYSGLQNLSRNEDLTPPPPILNHQSSGVLINQNNGSAESSLNSPNFTNEDQIFYAVGNGADDNLPSYDEVLNEHDEHNRRRRFQQNENYYAE